MSPKVYINGIKRPLLDDLRFSMYDHFPPGSVLFDMNTTPATEVKLCTEPVEMGVTQRKLLPNGRYGAFVSERGRLYYPSGPVCMYVLNLPPSARQEMLFQLFSGFDGVNVQKADIFRSADEECNGRGWVILQHQNTLSKIPSIIEYPPEFPEHILRVELSRELPPEYNLSSAENGLFENSLEGVTPSKMGADAGMRSSNNSNNFHYGPPLISVPPGTASHTIIRSPHPELLPSYAVSANGQKQLPMKGHKSSAMGGKTITNGMFTDHRGTARSINFFVVHLTMEEAQHAVENGYFVPRFPVEPLLSARGEEVELIFTVERNTLFFGIARLLTRQRGQNRCMISWICSRVNAPIQESDLLATSGAELPAGVGEQLSAYIRSYDGAIHSPSEHHSDSYGSPISYMSGSPQSPYVDQRFPNHRGRGRGRGYHHNGPYPSGHFGRGMSGTKEPRPIGEDLPGEYVRHNRPYSP